MKRSGIVFAIVMLVMLLAVFGCGKKQSGVTPEQFERDVLGQENVQGLMYSAFTHESEYTLDKYEITKEQLNLEDKEDIIYSDMTVKNDYFKVDLSVQCVFNYYDKGGWVLDEFNIEDIGEVIPINVPDFEMALEFVDYEMIHYPENDRTETHEISFTCRYENKDYTYYLDNGELTYGDEFIVVDANNVKLPIKYTNDIVEINGYCLFEFDGSGWACTAPFKDDLILLIEEYKVDYSSAEGEFILGEKYEYRHSFEYEITPYLLKIKEIKGSTVTYEFVYYDETHSSIIGTESFTTKIDDELDGLTLTLEPNDYISSGKIEYEEYNDTWYFSAKSREMINIGGGYERIK